MTKEIKFSVNQRTLIISLLLVGVLFNIVSYFHFRFASARKVDKAIEQLTLSSVKLYDDVLLKVDDYLSVVSSNVFSSVSSSFFSSSSSSSSSSLDDKLKNSPILPVVDSIEYDYYVKDGRHMARIGNQDFSDGSPFPRGGVISRVYGDCIILEGGYRVTRQNARVSSSLSRSAASRPSVASATLPDNFNQTKGLQL